MKCIGFLEEHKEEREGTPTTDTQFDQIQTLSMNVSASQWD